MKPAKLCTLAAAAILALSGCGTFNRLATRAAAVRDAIVEHCDFLVPVSQIAAILNAPGAPAANEVIEFICARAATGRAQQARVAATGTRRARTLAPAAAPPAAPPGRARVTFDAFGQTVEGELLPK